MIGRARGILAGALFGALLTTACAGGARSTPIAAEAEPPPADAPPADAECIPMWRHLPYLTSFARGQDAVDPQNEMLLDELVASTHQRYRILHLRVEGHRDCCGADATDSQLDERRAGAVVAALIRRGVPADRLSAEAYDDAQPRCLCDCGGSTLCRTTNSRVEYSVLACATSREVREEAYGSLPPGAPRDVWTPTSR